MPLHPSRTAADLDIGSDRVKMTLSAESRLSGSQHVLSLAILGLAACCMAYLYIALP